VKEKIDGASTSKTEKKGSSTEPEREKCRSPRERDPLGNGGGEKKNPDLNKKGSKKRKSHIHEEHPTSHLKKEGKIVLAQVDG